MTQHTDLMKEAKEYLMFHQHNGDSLQEGCLLIADLVDALKAAEEKLPAQANEEGWNSLDVEPEHNQEILIHWPNGVVMRGKYFTRKAGRCSTVIAPLHLTASTGWEKLAWTVGSLTPLPSRTGRRSDAYRSI